jgi:hypothetical protein
MFGVVTNQFHPQLPDDEALTHFRAISSLGVLLAECIAERTNVGGLKCDLLAPSLTRASQGIALFGMATSPSLSTPWGRFYPYKLPAQPGDRILKILECLRKRGVEFYPVITAGYPVRSVEGVHLPAYAQIAQADSLQGTGAIEAGWAKLTGF